MTDDSTMGGYLKLHDRAPAFEGSDGFAYSAAVYVDEAADQHGRYGGAVLFVRWSQEGDRPVGHLESPYLVLGSTVEDATAGVNALTLHQVKEQLERAIAAGRDREPL